MARKMLIVAGAVIGLGTGLSWATTSPDSHGSSHGTPSSRTHSRHSQKSDRDQTTTSETASNAADQHAAVPSKSVAVTTTSEKAKPTADEALTMLQEGNTRWVGNKDTDRHTESSRREDTASNGQFPFATIVTCADSRIPVERVFDQGVGDLFVIRVAGNVASQSSEVGTIEYGVGHLHTPVLVVMGHTKCGAVAAACSGDHLHGNVGDLVSNIYPAVERAKRNNPDLDGPALVEATVKENVWQTIFDLYRHSAETRKLVKGGDLKVVGAVYNISTGKVEWLGEHPWNMELAGAWDDTETTTQSTTQNPQPTTNTTTQVSVPTNSDDHGHSH